MTQFYQAVCPNCPGAFREEQEHWKSIPRRSRETAAINARTHDRIQHDGEETASVREFESDAIGHLPREEPEVSA